MSFTNTMENSLLKLIFQATAIANVADNASSSPLTNLYISLHTASPGETASGAEIGYGPYARVAVPRTSTTGGWTVTGNVASPKANIDFPACTGGTTGVATHFAVRSTSTGAGVVYLYGTVTPNISVAVGVTPRLTTASTVTLD